VRGFERDQISGPLGRRLADVAEGLSALADDLLVVSPVRAALPVPDHPRRGADSHTDYPGAIGPDFFLAVVEPFATGLVNPPASAGSKLPVREPLTRSYPIIGRIA
jgi:hypothetical protein